MRLERKAGKETRGGLSRCAGLTDGETVEGGGGY